MNYITNTEELTSIADAIREKGGTSAPLEYPEEYVSAIEAISGGGGGSDKNIQVLNEYREVNTVNALINIIGPLVVNKTGTYKISYMACKKTLASADIRLYCNDSFISGMFGESFGGLAEKHTQYGYGDKISLNSGDVLYVKGDTGDPSCTLAASNLIIEEQQL